MLQFCIPVLLIDTKILAYSLLLTYLLNLKRKKKTFNFNSKNLHKLFIDQLLNVIFILILKFSNKEEKNNEKQLKTNKINQKKIKI